MTTHIYRYAWTPIEASTAIDRFIGQSFPATLVRQWSNAIVDLQGDSSTKVDLDAAMIRLGWLFVETDPQFPAVVPTSVGGDNHRGRRAVPDQGARQLPAFSPFYSAGAPAAMAFVTPAATTWDGGHPPGTYLAVVDSSVVGQPVIVLDSTTGAVVQSLPSAALADGTGWNQICHVGVTNDGTRNDFIVIRQSATGLIAMIELNGGTVDGATGTVPAGGSNFFFDGAAIYIVGGDGALYTVNALLANGVGTWTQIQPPGTFDAATLYITGDNRYLYIPQPTSNRIARVGPLYQQNGAPILFSTNFSTAPAPQTPTGVTYDGRFLWVSLAGQGLLLQVDPASPFLTAVQLKACLSGANNAPRALAWDGDSVWATLPGANPALAGVGRVDPERTLSAGNGMYGVFGGFNNSMEILARPTPNGSWIYVLSTGDNSIRLLKNEPLAAGVSAVFSNRLRRAEGNGTGGGTTTFVFALPAISSTIGAPGKFTVAGSMTVVTSGAADGVFFTLTRDGTPFGPSLSPVFATNGFATCSIVYDDEPGVGTHTYAIQARDQSGGTITGLSAVSGGPGGSSASIEARETF